MARFHQPIITANRPIGDLCWMQLRAPELSTSVKAGHYILVQCTPDGSADPLLRRSLFVAQCDAASGTIGLIFHPHERGMRWLAQQPTGATLDLIGPFGTPFQSDPKSGNLLLIGSGSDIGALILRAHEATRQSLAVMLFVAASRADMLIPPFLLPPDVEYQSSIGDAATLLPLVSGTNQIESAPPSKKKGKHPPTPPPPAITISAPLRWADQCCIALPPALLPPLADAIRTARIRWERGFAQALLGDQMPCGTGACLACLVQTRSGMKTRCKEGPVFDLREL